MKHKIKRCNIRKCKDEATRWIGNWPTIGKTFYFCSEHAERVSPDDSEVHLLSGNHLITYELAVYSCSEKCEACN